MADMKALHKKARIAFRLTTAQRRDIDRAAKIESQRRGEFVEPGALARELTLQGVERILSKPQAAA